MRPAFAIAPGPGQESVWDYPRPPAVEQVLERVVVEHSGQTICDTDRALRVCETASPPTYYLPLEDVRDGVLQPDDGLSVCEWKGTATYMAVHVGDEIVPKAAWAYTSPHAEYRMLGDHVAFFPQLMDRCRVGAHDVTPQPGKFYGGWVTPDLVGPFKGEPGTGNW